MPRKRWDELDLLRGFAVLCMVLNHAGYAWLEPDLANGNSLSGMLTFLGSFAPVLFFFATGLGYGLQSGIGRREGRSHGLSKKVGILLLCDQFSAWNRGLVVYFDFLSFIALSMLVLEIPRRARKPVLFATVALLAAFALRFVGAPLLASGSASDETMRWVMRILGRDSIPGFSYPLFPWICFPLGGFLLGFFAQRLQAQLEVRILRVSAVFVGSAALAFSTAGFLIAHNHPANRWGTMSISYFCLSIGVLALSVLLAIWAQRVTKLEPGTRLLSLHGISSLAAVPVHFVFIALIRLELGTVFSEAGFLLACALLIVIVISAARTVAAVGDWLASGSREKVAWFGLVAAAASAGALLALLPTTSPMTRESLAAGGQLCLCVLLVVRMPRWAVHADA